jgi:hypothetical protein
MRKHILALALGGALAAGGPLFAQDTAADTPGDVFDASAFEQTVQQSRQDEQKARLETQFGGNFLYDTSATTTSAFAGYGLGGSFSGKGFLKVSVPDTGALYLAYNFSKNLYQGAAGTVPGTAFFIPPSFNGPSLSYPAGDLYDVSFALAELYASFDIAQAVFFRVGNQLLAWGPSFIWTPVDFVNLQRLNPLAGLDLRVGKPGIRLTVPLGPANIFLFGDLSGTVASAVPGGPLLVNDPLETGKAAARADLTVLGFELALTGYWGKQIQNSYGFDFSGRLLGFDVYGELAMAFPYDSYSFTYSYSLGFQRTLGELGYWSIAGEFFSKEGGVSDAAAYPSMITAGTFKPFYLGSYYAYAALTRSHFFVDGVSVSLAGFANFSDQSFLARLSSSFSLPGLVPFTASLSYAGGGAGKEFTYFTGDNSLTLDLRMSFEF